MDEDEGDEELVEASEELAGDDERSDRPERGDRSDRNERFSRDRRPRREEREERNAGDSSDGDGRQANGAGATIPFDVLPPAIGRDEEPAAAPEGKPRRPRPPRAPRPADDYGEIAPEAY